MTQIHNSPPITSSETHEDQNNNLWKHRGGWLTAVRCLDEPDRSHFSTDDTNILQPRAKLQLVVLKSRFSISVFSAEML